MYVTHDQEEALELSDRIVVMSDGRIEQIGTPFDVYNFPATPFVASFVGTLNAVEADGGRRGLRSPVASAARRSGRHRRSRARPGMPLGVALRPEMLSLGDSDAPGRNRIAAKVEDVAFLGAVVRIRVRVGTDVDAQVIDVDTFNNPNLSVPAIGDLVTVTFPPEACLVLGGAEAAERPTDILAAAEALL